MRLYLRKKLLCVYVLIKASTKPHIQVGHMSEWVFFCPSWVFCCNYQLHSPIWCLRASFCCMNPSSTAKLQKLQTSLVYALCSSAAGALKPVIKLTLCTAIFWAKIQSPSVHFWFTCTSSNPCTANRQTNIRFGMLIYWNNMFRVCCAGLTLCHQRSVK